ncbi:yqkD [Symbiodinium natans]|uniref:YqkD protein n=1 Tax=Symbiodinium natans TaxID=878477 RepID=A0A812SET8_9DINO|nr:yqkD [Symbiodinium natans]
MWRSRRQADEVDEQVQQVVSARKSKRSCVPFSGTYESIVEAIIRPPRAPYEASNLGPSKFLLYGHVFKRFDLQITNPQGLTLECSWWRPSNRELISESPLPCVVCLHGNSSCRLEALQHVRMVLTRGISLFAFDFAGCGLSEGDYITLGYHEREDVSTVISYLRDSGEVSTIALWGRSMGAATALLHGHRDPSIAGLVLDSPFASLEMVVRELIASAKRWNMKVNQVLGVGVGGQRCLGRHSVALSADIAWTAGGKRRGKFAQHAVLQPMKPAEHLALQKLQDCWIRAAGCSNSLTVHHRESPPLDYLSIPMRLPVLRSS